MYSHLTTIKSTENPFSDSDTAFEYYRAAGYQPVWLFKGRKPGLYEYASELNILASGLSTIIVPTICVESLKLRVGWENAPAFSDPHNGGATFLFWTIGRDVEATVQIAGIEAKIVSFQTCPVGCEDQFARYLPVPNNSGRKWLTPLPGRGHLNDVPPDIKALLEAAND
jgi:hypothetical protein